MADLQSEKALVAELYEAMDRSPDPDIGAILARHCSPDWLWRGFAPFGELHGTAAVAGAFWAPLRRALTAMRRRVDIFFAGRNQLDGFAGAWVVSTGHLVGLFDRPLLGIPPTRKMAFLRYCEFNRVAQGRIVETAMYFDLPHLMIQAGLAPFPDQAGAHLVQPGPRTHDGLLYGPQPAGEGDRTLAAINAMIADLGQWKSGMRLQDELRRSWAEDMIWWGPAGIGATCTIERYAQQHAGPFRAAFADRSKTTHVCRLAEGHYGGFFGWPNFSAVLSGPYMGQAPTGRRGDFRVADIYRRDGDKLAENWVFIDLLHFWKQQGKDILAELCGPPG